MELRKESEPQSPTFMTEGGAMLVLQYFCSLVTRQVSVALTSAGPAVQITWTTFHQTPRNAANKDLPSPRFLIVLKQRERLVGLLC